MAAASSPGALAGLLALALERDVGLDGVVLGHKAHVAAEPVVGEGAGARAHRAAAQRAQRAVAACRLGCADTATAGAQAAAVAD